MSIYISECPFSSQPDPFFKHTTKSITLNFKSTILHNHFDTRKLYSNTEINIMLSCTAATLVIRLISSQNNSSIHAVVLAPVQAIVKADSEKVEAIEIDTRAYVHFKLNEATIHNCRNS